MKDLILMVISLAVVAVACFGIYVAFTIHWLFGVACFFILPLAFVMGLWEILT